MTDTSTYERLSQFVLFQGLSDDDLNEIVAHTKLGFHKFSAGQTIASEGDASGGLYFLTHGKLEITTTAPDHGYSVSEYREAPEIFQMESVFGVTLHFTHTYKAASECSAIMVSMEDVRRLFNTFIVFRINFVNIITSRLQKSYAREWLATPQDMSRRIINFIFRHCIYPSGEKLVTIKMDRLAAEMNERRIEVSKALHAMNAAGTIEWRRGKIHITALEKLLGQQ